jgi:hypothetical protein
MKLVNSIEEIQELPLYRKHHYIKNKGLQFPCLVRFVTRDAYYGGSCTVLEICPIPKEYDLKSFIAGKKSKFKTYNEHIFKKKK